MIALDTTTKSLQIKLAGTVTANQLPFVATWLDTTATVYTPGETDGVTNNATAVTIVAAPAAATARQMKSLTVQNADTAAVTLTVLYNNNGTLRNMHVVTLAVGDTFSYEDVAGWRVTTLDGALKQSGGTAWGALTGIPAPVGVVEGLTTTQVTQLSSILAPQTSQFDVLNGFSTTTISALPTTLTTTQTFSLTSSAIGIITTTAIAGMSTTQLTAMTTNLLAVLSANQIASNLIQNSQSAAYTLVLTDAAKQIYHPSADTTARVWTIPANSSVAFPLGTVITLTNDTSAGALTIAITTDTLVWGPTGGTGSRTLAASGTAVIQKMTSTRWMITGVGLT